MASRVSAKRFIFEDIIEIVPQKEKAVKLHIAPRKVRAFNLAWEKG